MAAIPVVLSAFNDYFSVFSLAAWQGKYNCDFFPKFKNHKLRCINAPEPAHILWENLNVSSTARHAARINTMIIGLFLLGISFIMLVVGKTWLTTAYSNNHSSGVAVAELVSFLIALGICLINTIFEKLIKYRADTFECHHSIDSRDVSIFRRLLLFKYLNSCFLFLIVNNSFFTTLNPNKGANQEHIDDTVSTIAYQITRDMTVPSTTDFDYSWYASVGLILVLVCHSLSLVYPHYTVVSLPTQGPSLYIACMKIEWPY